MSLAFYSVRNIGAGVTWSDTRYSVEGIPFKDNFKASFNTELTGFSGILYFASRKDNLIFITGLDMKGMEKKYDLNSLTNLYAKSKMEIDRTGLRKFSAGTCTLGPNADYTGELEVGMSDHRGYFKIVSMK